jgi:hypothetical protein
VNDPAQIARLLRQYGEATKSWDLTIKEHSALLDLPVATFSRIRKGSYRGRLSQDKVTRIKYVVTIRRALDHYSLPPLWLLAHNALPEYNGETPIKKIFDEGIIGMYKVLNALANAGQR